MNGTSVAINRRQYLELENLADGAFSPLSGFMVEEEFNSVVTQCRLPGGEPFPLPVVLDLPLEQADKAGNASTTALIFEGARVGEIEAKSVFTCDKKNVAEQVFGTQDTAHPGVAHWFRMGNYFLGGPVRLEQRLQMEFDEYNLTPEKTRAYFSDQGWQTVVGFQTRNVPHRAHEHVIRLGLEHTDGLFVQPLVGPRKRGDYAPMPILAAYRTLIDGFLPTERVLLGVLSTNMRYAGPREALFHAIIRRNYGCTHFIVGRDHAGVGDYYGTYEAQEFIRQFNGEIGIDILRFPGAFYCRVCDDTVTERSCPHLDASPPVIQEISGTLMRELLSNGRSVEQNLMRPEIVKSIQGMPIFISEDAE
jgi:sulfate adenylyltransferase